MDLEQELGLSRKREYFLERALRVLLVGSLGELTDAQRRVYDELDENPSPKASKRVLNALVRKGLVDVRHGRYFKTAQKVLSKRLG